MGEKNSQWFINFLLSFSIQATTPDTLRAILLQGQEGKRTKYNADLRKFALQLQFVSLKAYLFGRKTFGNFLPGISTLRKYCCTLNFQPGVSREVLETLQKCKRSTGKTIIFILMIQEMSLKEQTCQKGNKYFGYVNIGVPLDSNTDDELTKANHALVFLLVTLNDSFKVPVSYFLIRHLNTAERANLVTTTLTSLYDYDIIVHFMTFDGASVNNSMAQKLGAVMDVNVPDSKFHILYPVTNEPILIFPDPCHMSKTR